MLVYISFGLFALSNEAVFKPGSECQFQIVSKFAMSFARTSLTTRAGTTVFGNHHVITIQIIFDDLTKSRMSAVNSETLPRPLADQQ